VDPERLRSAMHTLGLTATSLAKQAEVDVKTIKHWIGSQESSYYYVTLEKVARALGCEPAELLTSIDVESVATLLPTARRSPSNFAIVKPRELL
jgi:transcriptional regulator with XRE-family HTH domain